MTDAFTRRDFVLLGLGCSAGSLLPAAPASAESTESAPDETAFGRTDLQRVREVVGASHGRFERVKELVTACPELAKSAWDWGFGDFEAPIDAASHTGQREIVAFLLDHNARPTLFTHAMLGHRAVVAAMLEAEPGLRQATGPHGLTLWHHVRVGGEKARDVGKLLQSLGIPDDPPSDPPLPAEAYVGRYTTQDTPQLSVEVLTNRRGLAFKTAEGFPRNLVHVAGATFHPAGAASVQITFGLQEGKADRLTVAGSQARRVFYRR